MPCRYRRAITFVVDSRQLVNTRPVNRLKDMPSIVIPDDYPVVMGTSTAYQHFSVSSPVTYCDSLPGSEDALIDRLGEFEVVINIRSSTKFTERVFASCPRM